MKRKTKTQIALETENASLKKENEVLRKRITDQAASYARAITWYRETISSLNIVVRRCR